MSSLDELIATAEKVVSMLKERAVKVDKLASTLPFVNEQPAKTDWSLPASLRNPQSKPEVKSVEPERYPEEVLDEDDDDGTMVENVDIVRQAVVGHKIVSTEFKMVLPPSNAERALVITLDNGKQVRLRNTEDCCAYTELESFLLHPSRVDHIIMGVGTTDGYTTWHIYADLGDVLELTVDWSCGNPFHYSYGFAIDVVDL